MKSVTILKTAFRTLVHCQLAAVAVVALAQTPAEAGGHGGGGGGHSGGMGGGSSQHNFGDSGFNGSSSGLGSNHTSGPGQNQINSGAGSFKKLDNFNKPGNDKLGKSINPSNAVKSNTVKLHNMQPIPKITSNKNLFDNVKNGKLDPLTGGKAARRINLADQYKLAEKGDVGRRLNLADKLQKDGGWYKRMCGPLDPNYLKHCKGQFYCGPWWCPGNCWSPEWCGWVDWSFHAEPRYDPRPDFCQPISFTTAVDDMPPPVDRQGNTESWVDDPKPVAGALGGSASGGSDPTNLTLATSVLPPQSADSTSDNRNNDSAAIGSVAAAADYDLQLVAVRFVDNGYAEKQIGPRYRVWVRNNGQKAIEHPFNVVGAAAGTQDENAKLPHAGVRMQKVDAGQIVAVDIRLPIEANETTTTDDGRVKPKFPTIQVVVDVRNEINESTKENNAASFARSKVPMIDPVVYAADAKEAVAGQTINLAGEGLGPEAGQVLIRVGGLELQAEIEGWYDLGARVKLPNLPLASQTDVQIVLVRGDGAATNPLDIQLAAAQSVAPPVVE